MFIGFDIHLEYFKSCWMLGQDNIEKKYVGKGDKPATSVHSSKMQNLYEFQK
jgi:hypothetical protein